MTTLVRFRWSDKPSQVLMWELNGFWLCHFPQYRKQFPVALIIEKALVFTGTLSLAPSPSLSPTVSSVQTPSHLLQLLCPFSAVTPWASKLCCGRHAVGLELNIGKIAMLPWSWVNAIMHSVYSIFTFNIQYFQQNANRGFQQQSNWQMELKKYVFKLV